MIHVSGFSPYYAENAAEVTFLPSFTHFTTRTGHKQVVAGFARLFKI